MSAEPVWPTVDEVIEQTHGDRPKYFCDQAAKHAIDMCRAAWLVANDDPAASPIGEIRQSPIGHSWARFRITEHAPDWVMFGVSEGMAATTYGADVKGWPITGAVPHTPAAEADRG